MTVVFALLLGVLLGIVVMSLMVMARRCDDQQFQPTKEDETDAT